MSNAIATRERYAPPRQAFTAKQLATIKQTVARDTNDTEFDLFMEYANAKGLDPFSKQVIAIVFNKNAKDQSKRQMTIITTQDGLRVLAARCGDYGAAREEPAFEYDSALKGPTNPLGIVKCSTKLWKQDAYSHEWHPVIGWAYWDEYAPIKTDPRAYEMIDTGDKWPDGNPKKIKKLKAGVDLAKFQMLDDSGLWAKSPRVMIATCANRVALRSGWPAVFSGVYTEEEFDRTKILDLTASEMVEADAIEKREEAIAMSKDEFAYSNHDGDLVFVPAGQFVDNMLREARAFTYREQVESLRIRNRLGRHRFWTKHKNDCL
jgi:phage recombination protein Bet